MDLDQKNGCGLKWSRIDENTHEFIVDNAYKEYAIYNDDNKVIGHYRADGTLKNEASYRRIPIHPDTWVKLMQHKKEQKIMFRIYKMKWSKDCYVFLNRYREPFISDNLSKAMPKFIAKYNLDHMTVYGLRHSFATYCVEQGMRDIVLMPLMGHTDFNTTRKYYIVITRDLKLKELNKVYGTNTSDIEQETQPDMNYLFEYAKLIKTMYDKLLEQKAKQAEKEFIEVECEDYTVESVDQHLLQFINQNALSMNTK